MKYYFFNVDPIYKKICSTYELFIFFKKVYLKNNDSLLTEYQYNIFTNKINQKDINNYINNIFNDNRFYKHDVLYHNYNNKYRGETFSLKVGNNILIYNGNHLNKLLFKSLSNYSFFVCNFNDQDYFWSNEISC